MGQARIIAIDFELFFKGAVGQPDTSPATEQADEEIAEPSAVSLDFHSGWDGVIQLQMEDQIGGNCTPVASARCVGAIEEAKKRSPSRH